MEEKCKKCGTTEKVNFDGMCKKCYEDSIVVHEAFEEITEKITLKKNVIVKIAVIIFMIILCITFYVYNSFSKLKNENSDLTTKYKNSQTDLKKSEKEVKELKSLVEELQQTEKQNHINSNITSLENQIASLKSEITSLQAQRESLNTEIKKATTAEDVVLTAGNYVVGTDIKAGKYDAIAQAGSGNLFVHGTTRVSEMLGVTDSRYYIPNYNNITLKQGDTIEITSNLKVLFQAK